MLTTGADAGLPLLANDEVHAVLRDLWLQSAWMHGWYVGEYLLMPDRVHLFARPAQVARPLSHWIEAWKAETASRIARSMQWEGAIWRNEYTDRYFGSAADHRRACEDLGAIPLRSGLARTPSDWRFQGMIWDLQFVAGRV